MNQSAGSPKGQEVLAAIMSEPLPTHRPSLAAFAAELVWVGEVPLATETHPPCLLHVWESHGQR